jgi:hypothetical protein
MRMIVICVVLLGHALWAPSLVAAQDPGRIGSRILSLDSWTYETIERLLTRGYLPGLNPMIQPYRRIDVAAELADVDADTLPEPTAAWIRSLKEELALELERLLQSEDEAAGQRAGIQFLLGGNAADSRRRHPLVPYRPTENEGREDRLWSFWGGWPVARDTQRRGRDDTLQGRLAPGDEWRSRRVESRRLQVPRTYG